MAVAALENVLHKDGAALPPGQGGHERRLGVGREAGVGGRAHRPHPLEGAVPAQADGLRPALHVAPRLPQHGAHCGQVAVVHPRHFHRAAGGGRRSQVGSRYDAVAHDGIAAAVEGDAALHRDHRAARPVHLRPYSPQKALEIHDLRLPGGVGDGGGAGGAHRRQHGVLRGPHAGQGEHEVRPPQGSLSPQAAAVLGDAAAQAPDGPQVEVDGPGPQLTPAGGAQLGPSHAAQDGPQEDDGGAHLPHQRVGHVPARGGGGVHHHGVPLPLRPAAQVPEDVQGGRHVGQLRAVVDDALARGQKAGRQNGQYAVFCPVYPHRAVQGVSPLDDVSTHRSSLRKSFGTLSYAEGGRLVQLARFSIKRTRVW